MDRTFALIEQLSEPLDEALCSQAVEAALRTQKTPLARRFMDTWPGPLNGETGAPWGSRMERAGFWMDLPWDTHDNIGMFLIEIDGLPIKIGVYPLKLPW